MDRYYTGISGFLFCAANPVNYIDPTGMIFTSGSKKYVDLLKNKISDNTTNLSNQIKSKEAALETEELSDKDRENLNDDINELKSKIKKYNEVSDEISALEKSDQIYDMVLDTSKNIEGNAALGVTTIVSKTSYDVSSGIVRMTIGDSSLNMISHELKHAYQFETGELDFRATKGQTGEMYDITDEKAAYDRGRMFGPNQSSEKDAKSRTLPTSKLSVQDYHSTDSRELQSKSNRFKLIFRFKGSGYRSQSK